MVSANMESFGLELYFSDFELGLQQEAKRRLSFPDPQVKKLTTIRIRVEYLHHSKWESLLLFNCRTGDEKSHLIMKPLVQNLKTKTRTPKLSPILIPRDHSFHAKKRDDGMMIGFYHTATSRHHVGLNASSRRVA